MKFKMDYTKREVSLILKALAEYEKNHCEDVPKTLPYVVDKDLDVAIRYLFIERLRVKLSRESAKIQEWNVGDDRTGLEDETDPIRQDSATREYIIKGSLDRVNDTLLDLMERFDDPEYELEREEQFSIERRRIALENTAKAILNSDAPEAVKAPLRDVPEAADGMSLAMKIMLAEQEDNGPK